MYPLYFITQKNMLCSLKSFTFLYNSFKKAMFNQYFVYYIYANTNHLEEGDVEEGGIEVDELKGNISEFFLNFTGFFFFPIFL